MGMKTNGDRIRTMNNEGLAELLDLGCPPGEDYISCDKDVEECRKCWLDWLNSEAK